MSTITTTVQPATGSLLTQLLRRHSVIAFFLLTLGLTWPFMIADALRSHGFLPADTQVYNLLLMAYGPTWAALIVTKATTGKVGIRALLRRLFIWRVGLRWYAAAIFVPALTFFLPIKLYGFFGGSPPPLPTLSLELILNLVLLLVVSGLINGEEIGWRGYALPRLQERHSALTASLILGMIVFVFHLPLFVTQGSIQASMPMLGFLVEMLAGSVIMTWISNNTRGSLLLAYLWHAATNTWGHSQVFHVTAAVPLFWFHVGLVVLVAAIVVAVWGPARLSRKPAAELPVQSDTATPGLTGRTYAETSRRA
jgi:membrane protease YdiL (CAAX protease family)